MSTITFELVSPERLVVSRPVGMVTVPGEEGYFGVLAGHAPLVSTLRPGLITIHDNGAVTDRIFVAGGFAEVSAERCTVLAEDAAPLAELNQAQLEAELKKLQDELVVAPGELESKRLEKRIAVTSAKLTVLAAA